jgi:uncharacterized protein (UPF0254 family)
MSFFRVVLFREVSLRCRLAGGNANNGAGAGAFASNTNNAVSIANANVSSPLRFVSNKIKQRKSPATWQKTKSQTGIGKPVTVEGSQIGKADTARMHEKV